VSTTFAMQPTGSLDRGGEFLCLLNRAAVAAVGVRNGGLVVLARKIRELGGHAGAVQKRHGRAQSSGESTGSTRTRSSLRVRVPT
jgi:hypothetical protein